MSKPYLHAVSSARRWGGEPEDYIEIHDFMDSSKAVFPDNRHRALTHNSWFIFIVERIYGHNIALTGGGKASVRDVCEQHILEDFGGKFIPTPQDYIEWMDFRPWMNNAIEDSPSSHKKLQAKSERARKVAFTLD